MAIGRSITILIYSLHWLCLLHGCLLADWPWNELHGYFCFHTVDKSLTWYFFLRTLSTYKGSYATIDLQVSLFILSDSVLIFYVRCTSCGLILNALVITEYVEPSHFTIFHDNWFTTYHPSYKILLISVKLNHLAYICSFLHVH